MRFREIIQEAASFDVESVMSELISEMQQYELTNPEDWVDLYNDEQPDKPLNDEDRPWESPSFKLWLRAHILGVFHSLHSNKPIQAWRAIVANSDWTPENSGQHIGRHWSYTKDKAVPYDALRDGTLFVVEAMIPPTSVDWEEMVLHHLTRDADEDEVTIYHGAPVQIVNIESEPYGTGEDAVEEVRSRQIVVQDPKWGKSYRHVGVDLGSGPLHRDAPLVTALRAQWPDHPALAKFDREVAAEERARKRSEAAKKAAATRKARAQTLAPTTA